MVADGRPQGVRRRLLAKTRAEAMSGKRSGDQRWRSARITRMMSTSAELDLRRRSLKCAGRLRNWKNRACIPNGCQQLCRHAATEQAAVGLMAVAAIMIAGVRVMFADAERIAKGVELRGDRHFAEGEGADDGLQDEQEGRDKRKSPSFASSQHDQSPFRNCRKTFLTTGTYAGIDTCILDPQQPIRRNPTTCRGEPQPPGFAGILHENVPCRRTAIWR